MKRHQELQQLSREHHDALRLALQARRAAQSGDPAQIGAAAAACMAEFAVALEPHFLLEEETLLPLLNESGDEKARRQAEQDHAALRQLAGELAQPDAANLLAFADLLTAHVRFEEREMFEILETRLPDAGKS